MILIIDRRKRIDEAGLCANKDCLAPLEPPYNVFTFELAFDPGHVYRRRFCVECASKMLARRMHSIHFKVLTGETL
jgi:hypothetical protein